MLARRDARPVDHRDPWGTSHRMEEDKVRDRVLLDFIITCVFMDEVL